MKLRRLFRNKRLLSLLVAAIATLAAIIVSAAIINRTTTQLADNDHPIKTFPINTDGEDVVHGFAGLASGTPLVTGFTPMQLADNSGGLGSGMLVDDGSTTPTQNTSGDEVVDGSGSTSSDTSSDSDHGSTPVLLAKSGYIPYDHDLQATPVGASPLPAGGGPNPPTEPNDEPASHVPEPATMLLLGSGLIGLAAFGRKLRKH